MINDPGVSILSKIKRARRYGEICAERGIL